MTVVPIDSHVDVIVLRIRIGEDVLVVVQVVDEWPMRVQFIVALYGRVQNRRRFTCGGASRG
jgi:hypothetical protein